MIARKLPAFHVFIPPICVPPPSRLPTSSRENASPLFWGKKKNTILAYQSLADESSGYATSVLESVIRHITHTFHSNERSSDETAQGKRF